MENHPTTGSDPDIHLRRLLVDTGGPWYRSLHSTLKDLFVGRKLPPLKVTSRPVPVPELWGECRYGRYSGPGSLLLHAAVILALAFIAKPPSIKVAPLKPDKNYTVMQILPFPRGGGGGGDRSPEPASKGRLPKLAMQQLTPPEAVIRNPNPELPEEPTVIVPPNITLPPVNIAEIGDPLSQIGPRSNGTGSDGGIGTGSDGGVGPGHGPGAGPGEGGGFNGLAFRVGSGVTAPQAIYQVEPEYTEAARKAKYQGTVVLHIVVGPDGRVHTPRVVRALGLGLDEKALDAVSRWKFRPGMKDGQPVAVTAQIEVTFRLL